MTTISSIVVNDKLLLRQREKWAFAKYLVRAAVAHSCFLHLKNGNWSNDFSGVIVEMCVAAQCVRKTMLIKTITMFSLNMFVVAISMSLSARTLFPFKSGMQSLFCAHSILVRCDFLPFIYTMCSLRCDSGCFICSQLILDGSTAF